LEFQIRIANQNINLYSNEYERKMILNTGPIKMRKTVNLVALFLLMLIAGVFWGTWFTMTRTIENFLPDEFIHIGKVIIGNVAMPMRIIMPSGIVFIVWSLWLDRRKRKIDFYLGVLSLVLLIVVLLITVLGLVPMDNSIKTWTTVPPDFAEIRHEWKTLHAVRTFLSLAGFIFFSIFVLCWPTAKGQEPMAI